MKKKNGGSGIAETLNQTWNGNTAYIRHDTIAVLLVNILSNRRNKQMSVNTENNVLTMTGAKVRSLNSHTNIPLSQKWGLSHTPA